MKEKTFIPCPDYFAFRANLFRNCGTAWKRLQTDYPYKLLKAQSRAVIVNFLMRRVP